MTTQNKTLTLMRHGESDQFFRGRDFDRPLTENGYAFCTSQSSLLLKKSPVDFILCSGALRTRQTLDALKDELSIPQSVIYDDALFLASTRYLIEQIESIPENKNHALVIGHGPTVSGTYQWLTDGSETQHLLFSAGDIKSMKLSISNWLELYPGCDCS